MDTKGFKGNIHKTAEVYTNDPRMNRIVLGIRAFVQVSIFVSPSYVQLNGKEDTSVTKSVEIKAGLEKPLTLEPAEFNLEGKVTYTIQEIEKGRKYNVTFTNVPGIVGAYNGYLNLKTNYEEKPSIIIKIRGRLEKTKQEYQSGRE